MKLACLFLLGSILAVSADLFEGPGPDPACEGTALTVKTEGGVPVFLEYAIGMSNKTIIEKFRLDYHGWWNILIEIYPADRNGGTPAKLLSAHRFKSTDAKVAIKASKALDLENFDWANEPQRLISYFQENGKEFTKLPEPAAE